MVCETCGKTAYWCEGHIPFRVSVPYHPADVENRRTS